MTNVRDLDISMMDFPSVWRPASRVVDASSVSAEVALALCCSTCGGQPVVDHGECDPCRKYRDRTGQRRPARLIRAAAKRLEENDHKSLRKEQLTGSKGLRHFDELSDPVSPTLGEYDPLVFAPKLCICGCRRAQDTFKNTDQLSKPCRDLRYVQQQRSLS